MKEAWDPDVCSCDDDSVTCEDKCSSSFQLHAHVLAPGDVNDGSTKKIFVDHHSHRLAMRGLRGWASYPSSYPLYVTSAPPPVATQTPSSFANDEA
jgi:hypothetical protein